MKNRCNFITVLTFFFVSIWSMCAQELIGSRIVVEDDNFAIGQDVQISDDGNRIAVSGYGKSTYGIALFDLIDGVWTKQPSFFTTEFPELSCIYSVAMSSDGNKLAIGTTINRFESNHGEVFVYHFDGTQWNQIGSSITGVSEDEFFGHSLDITDDGLRIVVGARLNSDTYMHGGRVGVYQFADNSWSQLGESIYGRSDGHKLGSSVEISRDGSLFTTGSSSYSTFEVDVDNSNLGSVFGYQFRDGNWYLSMRRTGNRYDRLGYSVAISGNAERIAAGANQLRFKDGFVDVYDLNNHNFADIFRVSGEENAYLGGAVSLSQDGNIMAASAIQLKTDEEKGGSISIYGYDGEQFVLVGKIQSDANDPNFGTSINLSGDGKKIAISSINYTYGISGTETGYIRVYDLNALQFPVLVNPPQPPPPPPNVLPATIYPSPATTELFCGGCEALIGLDIFDISGKKIATFSKEIPETINVSMLRSGVYYVFLYTENSDPEVQKFIKN